VRAYLAEFLSDPRVVPLPRWVWLPILNNVVLRVRSKKSAEKYAQIWTAEGSPLAVHTVRQAQLLSERMNTQVRHAMRYGAPRVREALSGLRDPVVVPLYPQYAESTTGSVLAELPAGTRAVREFHEHPAYIAALAAVVAEHWAAHGRGGMLVMSFHGLPRRGAGNYERDCRRTALLLAQRLALKDNEWRVAFQSRFGYARWLEPYTESTLQEFGRMGLKRVDVFCPGFVSDCLETLEELGIRGRQKFREAGGAELHLVPCLNESPQWISALAQIALT
jgi:protoporphyrin/coproporphyrin ferrochelatase